MLGFNMLVFNIKQVNEFGIYFTKFEVEFKMCNSNADKKLTYAN